jgi:predicted DNA-binding transcriptional regulator AlpA
LRLFVARVPKGWIPPWYSGHNALIGQWDQRVVGLLEVAHLLGVPVERVDQVLREDPSFPKPVAVIGAGQIWKRRDVERWARKARHREL